MTEFTAITYGWPCGERTAICKGTIDSKGKITVLSLESRPATIEDTQKRDCITYKECIIFDEIEGLYGALTTEEIAGFLATGNYTEKNNADSVRPQTEDG